MTRRSSRFIPPRSWRADPYECAAAKLGQCKVLREMEQLMGKKTERLVEATPGGSCAGKSIYEMISDRLDEVVARLMADEAEDRDPGRAEGLGIALSIMKNAYYPDVDDIRNDAMVRWERSQVVEEPTQQEVPDEEA